MINRPAVNRIAAVYGVSRDSKKRYRSHREREREREVAERVVNEKECLLCFSFSNKKLTLAVQQMKTGAG